jgi:hypothetical protein
MNTWAVLAAKHAVVPSGPTTAAVPAAGPVGLAPAARSVSSEPSGEPSLPPPPLPRRVPGLAYPGLNYLNRHRLADPAEADPGEADPVEAGQGHPGAGEPARPGEEQASRPETGPDRFPRQPDSRPKPRHAAPTASFGRRLSRLFTIRLLASGAHT